MAIIGEVIGTEGFPGNENKENQRTYQQLSKLENWNVDGRPVNSNNLQSKAFDSGVKRVLTDENTDERETCWSQSEENRRTYQLISGVANQDFDGSPEKTGNSTCRVFQMGIGQDILADAGRDEMSIGQDILERAGSDEEKNASGIKATENKADENNKNLNEEDKEYWRPSYMFHWLRAVGRNIDEAYEAFEEYRGRASYEELGLNHPGPLLQDERYTDEWSHMSDYDNTGVAPGWCDEAESIMNNPKKITTMGGSREREHCDESRFRMALTYDDDEEPQVCEQERETPNGMINSDEQVYQVNEWYNRMDDSTIACFTRGGRSMAGMDRCDADAGRGEDQERFVCNMTGDRWEQLPFPIIIDLGACASVIPTSWCPHVAVTPTKQSEAGE